MEDRFLGLLGIYSKNGYKKENESK
jgi:hypothetical protein